MRASLRLPVDSSARIADGTVQRFLKWHLKNAGKSEGGREGLKTCELVKAIHTRGLLSAEG
jgi:hypothetical protein